jgi:glutamyl-tRNA reductase
VIVVGLSHRSAPIEVRERLAFSATQLPETLTAVTAIDSVSEAVVLSTCNRTEIYAASPTGRAAEAIAALSRFLGELGGRPVVPHLMTLSGRDAIRHLFRVTSSLDSLVVGEPQILGQVKEAMQAATEAGTLGPVLSAAMRGAVQVAKRIRTDTAIGAGQVSISSVAVDLARHIFEDLAGHTTLLVGAGEMAETAAKLLARGGVQLLVVNRSAERAEELASAVGGRPRRWNELESCLIEADIVVSSTASPHPVITRDLLSGIRRSRRGRSLFLIDIAVPRDVEPAVGKLDNVYLYDIDDLSHVVAESMDGRVAESARAEMLVDDEVDRFARRRSEEAMTPLIVALRERTREVLLGELDKSCKGRLKHLNDGDREALNRMLDAAMNKLLHQPTARLKQMAGTPGSEVAAQLVRELFDLELQAPVAEEVHDDEPREESAEEAEDEPRVAVRG